ncbi:hypothetical protein PR202_ga06325 [Eleusine coracana subsp. coracana]|uniref:DUF6598 domain-containing protein n=1 Tax=Eleusine coracana subsp. coracana TaxID=191504 RepID=A0AAV5BWE3_ELECO|nr:hypothetical protein PR202_ga06325 [Eleusine coracana subsp. coracana]
MEKASGDGEDGGKQRDRSNLGESEETGGANKEVDPVLEFWARKMRQGDEKERAKYPDEDWIHIYLVLTGPTRAVVVCNPVHLEAVLKLKGSIESEDKELSLFTEPIASSYDERFYTHASIEATINVQVTDGAWPVGFYDRFTAHTASLEDNRVELLDSGDEKVFVDADGLMQLSRHVASVETDGELTISVEAFGHDNDHIIVVGKDDEHFTPKWACKSVERDGALTQARNIAHYVSSTMHARVSVIMTGTGICPCLIVNVLDLIYWGRARQNALDLTQGVKRGGIGLTNVKCYPRRQERSHGIANVPPPPPPDT